MLQDIDLLLLLLPYRIPVVGRIFQLPLRDGICMTGILVYLDYDWPSLTFTVPINVSLPYKDFNPFPSVLIYIQQSQNVQSFDPSGST